MDGKYVSYLRVSSKKQGESGLGLEAQRRAVHDYLNGGAWELIGEFQEIESGKNSDRAELKRAMERCRLTGATLLIAKLDRLSRNVHFLSGLMEQGVRFVACDMPTANELTVHIMAAVAEAERKAISSRTKAAMAVVKRKLKAGEEHVSSRTKQPITRLGNPNGLKVSRRDLGTAGLIAKADEFAARVLPTIREIQSSDVVSLARIAAELNARHILTARGSKWSPMSVKRVLDRSRDPKSDAA